MFKGKLTFITSMLLMVVLLFSACSQGNGASTQASEDSGAVVETTATTDTEATEND